MKNILENKWKLKNVKIIQNGTDINIFKYSRNKDVDKLYGKENYKILYVGRLIKRKGIIELIDSFQYLKNENIKLLIVGYGNLRSKIVKKIYRYDNKIVLIPYVEKSKLAYYYSSADLVIIPSKYEPSSLVAKEALSCGTPVLVGRNSGLKELQNAYFIDKILPNRIAVMILKLKVMKLPSRKFYRNYILENYSWTKSITSLESLYKQALINDKEITI
jgi:glycosyltransferase involved in cell wall biosynthesis